MKVKAFKITSQPSGEKNEGKIGMLFENVGGKRREE